MSKKIIYTDEPIGKVKVIADFLPTPAELAFNEEAVKVTLALSKKSIDFFKSEAAKNHYSRKFSRRCFRKQIDCQRIASRLV